LSVSLDNEESSASRGSHCECGKVHRDKKLLRNLGGRAKGTQAFNFTTGKGRFS